MSNKISVICALLCPKNAHSPKLLIPLAASHIERTTASMRARSMFPTASATAAASGPSPRGPPLNRSVAYDSCPSLLPSLLFYRPIAGRNNFPSPNTSTPPGEGDRILPGVCVAVQPTLCTDEGVGQPGFGLRCAAPPDVETGESAGVESGIASMAGLPLTNAWVKVGPPLSAKGELMPTICSDVWKSRWIWR